MLKLSLIQNTPGINVNLIGVSGINGGSIAFDPGTGEIIIITGAIQGPKSFGWFDIEIDDNGIITIERIYLIDCCIKGLNPDEIYITELTSNMPNPGLIAHKVVLVLEELTVDVSTTIIGSTVYFGSEARVYVNPGSDLAVTQSKLTTFCPYLWDGIYASQTNSWVEINTSEIENSARGVHLQDNVPLIVTNTIFTDNVISLIAQNYSGTGSFYNTSRWDITGTAFSTGASLLPFAAGSTIKNDILALTGGAYAISIKLDDANQIQIGKATSAQNSFTGPDAIAVLAEYSKFYLEHALITDISRSIIADYSIYRMGGGSTNHACNVVNGGRLISNFSSQRIEKSSFFNSEVEIYNPTNNNIEGFNGTLLNLNEFENTPVEIKKWHNSQINENVHFTWNEMNTCSLTMEGFTTVSLNEGVLVTDNRFYYPFGGIGSSLLNKPHGTYSLYLKDMDGIRVGHNRFQDIPAGGFGFPPPIVPIPNWRAGGIKMINVPNAQIKDNAIDSCVVGIYGYGNLLGTTFCLNLLKSSFYGMYFEEADLSNQGTPSTYVSNLFTNSYDKNIVFEYCTYSSIYYTWAIGSPSWNPASSPGIVYLPVGSPQNTWQIGLNALNMGLADCDILTKTIANIPHVTDEFLLYPNPFLEQLFIEFNRPQKQNSAFPQLEIYNAQGLLIDQVFLNDIKNQITIKGSAGMYLVKIIDSNGQVLYFDKINRL